ncbi:SDR family oxidoreductase [Maricurvus nonylphenolicus]|uniref:SDR family NAD(P)-dependent oxidoreductase n=1 Tax=Maricurvus nonylphenolicus TaxID=1008307 RepID=UPI0036F2F921
MKKTLLITGASRGIGLATAELFKREGYEIINISRTACPIEGSVNLRADFSDIYSLEVIQDKLINEISATDSITLVHNAALLAKGSIQQIDSQAFQSSMTVNVIFPAMLNQVVIPHMPAKSAIIYIGSTLSEKGVANSAAYVTSKHAVAGMMRATCQDLANTEIHTACVCPGFTETEMLKEHVGTQPELLASIAAQSTKNRLIAPLEIAKTIYFCAQNPVINGALIHANTGQLEM